MLPHERLDAALNERRLNLRIEWNDVAAAIGIRARSLLDIRRGRNGPSPLTARAMDDWLGWKPGSVEGLYAGREPTPLDQTVEAGQAVEQNAAAETSAELDDLPTDPAELVRLARQMIAQGRQDRRRSEEKFERAEEILRRLAGADDEDVRHNTG